MKNAEELFDEQAVFSDIAKVRLMNYNMFLRAIKAYDQELISEIEKKIEEDTNAQKIEVYKPNEFKDNGLIEEYQTRIEALTEIINLIKET